MENLKDETGRNLNAGAPWSDTDDPNMDSLAAAPFAADFDGDGDHDMLIGNIGGNVVLMTNAGSKERPVFSTKRVKLKAGGAQIVVPGGDAGPVLADWDRDGKRDLLVGAGDGSVWLYRNTGEDPAPSFEKGVALVVRRARVPVVPAVIVGSFEAWPRHRQFPRPSPIRVRYGPPMHFDGLEADQIVATIDSTLRRMFEELRGDPAPAGRRVASSIEPSSRPRAGNRLIRPVPPEYPERG